MTTQPTRRQRLRDATVEEIKTVARDLMAREGSSSINLRAIAREMGMTASAIYRYFESRDAILTALIRDAYDAVGLAVEEAMAAAPRDSSVTAILAGVHAFRRWALGHPQEYGLIYGTPVPGYQAPHDEMHDAAMRTNLALLSELVRGIAEDLIVPPPTALPADVSDMMCRMASHADKDALGLPPEVWAIANQFWIVLYGTISSEVFGHQPPEFEGDGQETFFDFTMRGALRAVGVRPEVVAAGVSPGPAT